MAEAVNPQEHIRSDLDKLASDAGLKGAATYPNKQVVADAINRVNAGEDPTAVNAELASQAPEAGQTAPSAPEDQKASTQAAEQPQKKIYAVDGGHPTKFDQSGNPVYDLEQV